MTLDELQDAIQETYTEYESELAVELDRETKNELAMLTVALEPDDSDEIVRRAIHNFFQMTVERGTLDFHLRSGFDCTYDEYLSGMTFDQMTGNQFPQQQDPDDRRYQF